MREVAEQMVENTCEKLDPRIRRTRQLLHDALNKLLKEKEFDKISIQEIAETATLNRGTFYAHYPDKFALLEDLIRVEFLKLLSQRSLAFDGTCSSAFRAIILAVCDYLAEKNACPSSQQHQFAPYLEATVINQIRLVLLDGFQRHPAPCVVAPELMAATASWAIYGAVKQWVNTETRIPAEEFVTTVVNLVQPILSGGLQPVASN